MSTRSIVENIVSGKKSITVERSGMASLAYCLEYICTQKKYAVVVLPFDAIQELLSYVSIFTPQFESSFAIFPSIEQYYKDSRLLQAKTLQALYSLTHSSVHVSIVPYSQLVYTFPPQASFTNRTLEIYKGMELPYDSFLEMLISWGYKHVPIVYRCGDIARRGDIIDVFPPNAFYQTKRGKYEALPIRIEFFGDIIEDIRVFTPESQRFIEKVERHIFFPIQMASYAGAEEIEAYHNSETMQPYKHSLSSYKEKNLFSLPSAMYQSAKETLFSYLPKNAILYTQEYQKHAEYLEDAYSHIKEYCIYESARSGVSIQPDMVSFPQETIVEILDATTRVDFEPLMASTEGKVLQEHRIHSFAELCTDHKALERPWQTVLAKMKEWKKESKQALILFKSLRNRDAFMATAQEEGIVGEIEYIWGKEGIFFCVAELEIGIGLEWADTILIPENILYPQYKAKSRSKKAFKGLKKHEDLQEGEYIIHKDYGIGKYAGLHRIELGGTANDYLLLYYANEDKVYIPVDQIGVVQRYVVADEEHPYLDTLGGSGWKNSLSKAKKSIETVAQDLVAMYASRKLATKHRYGAYSDMYKEFEMAFGFEETPDQAQAIEDVLSDMDNAEPMDRLVCGDVGFGKTEIAIRASVRAGLDGRQVLFLCPTTILAEQHYHTIQQRLSMLPLSVRLLSRFVSKAEQKKVLEGLAKGEIDIVIGTHRLLSADIHAPNLSLLILDEEHRFGVRHKEKLKLLKQNIDSLTLTATPIPRTLQLSMAGIRELSTIETPPSERKAIESLLCEQGDVCIQKALYKELERGGQIFWVYNRVRTIEEKRKYIQELCPEARIGILHGQMNEKNLEETMRAFWEGEIEILLATSIIESGLDFPLANTIIIDNAQMFGLSQLYQLRGRVGRGDRQAYAIFVIPSRTSLSDIGYERLQTIVTLDYLGAGFHIAMEDLRIRGAGNILGEAQSGHIGRIGIELYLEMLAQEVQSLQAGKPIEELHTKNVELSLSIPVFIPEEYIEDTKERLRYYRKLSHAETKEEHSDICEEMHDRFGVLPAQVHVFSVLITIKQILSSLGVAKASLQEKSCKIYWKEGQNSISPENIFRWVERHKDVLRVLPPATVECTFSGKTVLESLQNYIELLEDLQKNIILENKEII